MEIEKWKGISRNKETAIYIQVLLLYLRRNEEGMPQTLPIFSKRVNSASSSSPEIKEADFVTIPTLTFWS